MMQGNSNIKFIAINVSSQNSWTFA